jgi:glyoxylase-like metal-dependent hydrolase (beta-lactamase superfamily II)
MDNKAFGTVFEALSLVGHPTETFTATGKLAFGQDPLEYTHIPLAHTDGDAYVFFPGANVLHTGDLLFLGRYPVVDYSAGGSLAAMAGALERMDRVGDARTRIIPGHGPVATKAEMRAAREMWLAINQRLEEHAKAGRSVDEVVKAGPTKDFDAKLGVNDPSGFVRQAYGGVLERRR